MKFSLDSETRSACSSDEEHKSSTPELSLTESKRDDSNKTTLNIVDESIDSVMTTNENLHSQKVIFTRLTYNRWKCVFIHNSTVFSCSICDATCRSYQKLKQHRLLQHPFSAYWLRSSVVTVLISVKTDCGI